MLKRLNEWFDSKVYWWFFRRLDRMFRDDPGMCYLVELHLTDWRKRNPLPQDLKAATEIFFATQKDPQFRKLLEAIKPDRAERCDSGEPNAP